MGRSNALQYHSIVSEPIFLILLHEFELLPLVGQVQHPRALLKPRDVLPKGLEIAPMRITYRLQVPDSPLERIASDF